MKSRAKKKKTKKEKKKKREVGIGPVWFAARKDPPPPPPPQRVKPPQAPNLCTGLLEALCLVVLFDASKEPRSLFAMDGTSYPTLAHTRIGNDSRTLQQANERAISFPFDSEKVERNSALYSVA